MPNHQSPEEAMHPSSCDPPRRESSRIHEGESGTSDNWGPSSLPAHGSSESLMALRLPIPSSVASAARRASSFIPRSRHWPGRQVAKSPRDSLAAIDPSKHWCFFSTLLDNPSLDDVNSHDPYILNNTLQEGRDEEEILESPSAFDDTLPERTASGQERGPAHSLSPVLAGDASFFTEPEHMAPLFRRTPISSEISIGPSSSPAFETAAQTPVPAQIPPHPYPLDSRTDSRFHQRSSYFPPFHEGPSQIPSNARTPDQTLRREEHPSTRRPNQAFPSPQPGRHRFSSLFPSTIPPIPIGADPLAFISSQLQLPKSLVASIPCDIHKPPLIAAASHLLLKHADEDAGRLDVGSEPNTSTSPSLFRRAVFPQNAMVRGIVKCMVAYFMASLFTFCPALSESMANWIPHRDSDRRAPIANLHMVATVAVYFHAARTRGAMALANGYAILGLSVVATWCTISMWIAETLHEYGWPGLSNLLVVGFFVGVGVGVGSWSKTQPHLQPAVWNTTGTMGSILLFVVLAKEGSPHLGRFSSDKVYQVAACCLLGSMISSLVCLGLWPESTTDRLQQGTKKDLEAFARLLRAISTVFLLDDKTYSDPSCVDGKDATSTSSQRALVGAIGRHGSSFTRAQTETEEACLEAWIDPRMNRPEVRQAYRGVAQCLTRLAQHLAALRAPCNTPSPASLRAAGLSSMTNSSGISPNPSTPSSAASPDLGHLQPSGFAAEPLTSATNDIGPAIRSFVFTCSQTLLSLRAAFPLGEETHNPGAEAKGGQHTGAYGATATEPHFYEPGAPFSCLATNLAAAVRRFSDAQSRFNAFVGMKWVGQDSSEKSSYPTHSAPEMPAHGHENCTDPTHEDTYGIVFFSWTLFKFAAELGHLISLLEIIRAHESGLRLDRDSRRIRDASRTFWTRGIYKAFGLVAGLMGPFVLIPAFLQTVFKVALASLYSLCLRVSQSNIPTGQLGPGGHSSGRITQRGGPMPGYMSHYPGTLQTPFYDSHGSWRSRWADRLWRASRILHRPNVRFAIKAGGGAAILASPAFIMSTRPIFETIQGQWALVSFFVVMSPTVGQSTYMGFQRTVGTLVGVSGAVIAYNIFPDDNIWLPVFGLLFAIPCFYVIVATPARASSGRLVLLAYNLVALYSYNVRKTGLEVEEVAIYRAVSVLLGVAWAAILSTCLWPMEARRLLAQGTSDLLFNLAWLYQAVSKRALSTRLKVERYDDCNLERQLPPPEGELSPLTRRRSSAPVSSERNSSTNEDDDIARMILTIQVAVIWLQGLLPHTTTEFRLKGPFPGQSYLEILASAQGLLDSLQGLSAAAQVAMDTAGPSPAASGAFSILPSDSAHPAEDLALELTGNTVLVLYLLAASFRLKTPLPPFMPRVEAARQKLLAYCHSPPSSTDKVSNAVCGHLRVPGADPDPKKSDPRLARLRSTTLPQTSPSSKASSPAFNGDNTTLSANYQRTIQLYSYALGMKEVARRLDILTDLTQRTLGVVGGESLSLPL